MNTLLRLFLLLGVAGSAATMLGSAAAWWMDENRRLRRLVRNSLGGEPDGAIVALGRNAAAGFRLASQQVVVMRQGGAQALLYPLQSLLGAELIVDDQVVARAMRDEPRRAPDQIAGASRHVVLRLVFDDPRHPDFELELWTPEDELRRHARQPAQAIREARGWLTRTEALLRRARPADVAPRQASPPVEAPVEPPQTVVEQGQHDARLDEDGDEDWDDDDPPF